MISAFLLTTLIGAQPSLSIKVEGDGYLRFAKGAMTVYARQAKLVSSPEGMTASDGSILVPRIMVPVDVTGMTVTLDGSIVAKTSFGTKALGRIVLAIFPSKTTFTPFGSFVRASTKPTLTNPGEGLAGIVRSFVAAGQTAAKQGDESHTAGQPFAGLKAEIKIGLKSEVDEDYIKLGSIAEIEGPAKVVQQLKNVELGRSPVFGSSRGLTLTHVRATLIAAKIDIRTVDLVVPSGAVVERKCQKIEAETITLAVQEAVKKKLGFETQLELKNRFTTQCVPTGPMILDVAQVQMHNGQIAASVDILVNNKMVSSLSLTYSMPGIAQVKRGEVVRLRMISNTAKVEVSAKAKTDAYLGQKITVETGTGAVQTGTLIGASLVEVRL